MYIRNTARSKILGLIAVALPFATAACTPLTGQGPVRIPPPLQVRSAQDNGALSPSTPLQHMRVLLSPSVARQRDLEQLLAEQRTPGNRNYHKWLKPEEFGMRFGVSEANEAKVKTWLARQGFTNVQSSNSRTAITFDGTVATAQTAFQTEIHSLTLNGEKRFSNVKEAVIPSELANLVRGVRGLNNLRVISQSTRLKPQYTYLDGTGATPELAPGDIAKMYDIQTLYNQGIDGSGVTVAVLGLSDINPSDISAYQSGFNLPANPPMQLLVPGSADPGFLSGDREEASLDLEMVSAVARGSNIVYVYGTDGYAALEYTVDNNVANVVSMSFNTCEPDVMAAGVLYWYEMLTEQANAEGITIVNSSGDTGAAACDAMQETAATQGEAVYFPADLPEVTSVGGTSTVYPFASYFNESNASDGGSLLSYIPEISWNDTPTQGHLQSSGGGASVAFSKPGWQDAPGVPSDGARDVPDLSLFSLDAYHEFGYIFCENNDCASGSPNGFTSGGVAGGTSAGAPLFAGMVALLNNYLVANGQLATPGLGNINPQLYLLANNATNVFHDITQGNNIVPCESGSPNCDTGSFGYSAGPGYDQVTGIGSIDVANLASEWSSHTMLGSQISLTSSSPSGIGDGGTVTFIAKVSATGNPTFQPPPTGSINFYDNLDTTTDSGTTTNLVATVTLDATGTARWNGVLRGDGLHTITAVYSGSSQYSEGSSASLSQIVQTPSVVVFATPNMTISQQGSSSSFNVRVQPTNGNYPGGVGSNGSMQDVYPTGTVTFYLGSIVLGSIDITKTQTFATSSLPVGTDSVTAEYSGDSYYEPGESTIPDTVTIQPSTSINTTTTLVASTTQPALGSSITLTATVNPVLGTTAPSGTVNFSVSGTSLGTAMIVNGIASYTTTNLPLGSNSITASYTGATGFGPSVSTAITVTVEQPEFTIAANPSALSTKRGNTASTEILLTALNGFNSSVALACSGLPTGDTCTFGGATKSTGTVSYALTINTVKSSVRGSTAALAFLPLAALFAFHRRKSLQSLLSVAAAMFALVSILGSTGCGTGVETYSSPSPSQSSNSTIVVMATSPQGTTYTTSLILSVY